MYAEIIAWASPLHDIMHWPKNTFPTQNTNIPGPTSHSPKRWPSPLTVQKTPISLVLQALTAQNDILLLHFFGRWKLVKLRQVLFFNKILSQNTLLPCSRMTSRMVYPQVIISLKVYLWSFGIYNNFKV